MMPDSIAGRRYDAALHLLDRQILDPDGRMLGNVDDLELVQRPDGSWAVIAILTGPGALGPRLRGRLGQWTVGVWRRLRSDSDPQPARIDIALVEEITSAVHLIARPTGPGIEGLESWVRRHVIDRIPGNRHDPE
jgi:hypothetical protein